MCQKQLHKYFRRGMNVNNFMLSLVIIGLYFQSVFNNIYNPLSSSIIILQGKHDVVGQQWPYQYIGVNCLLENLQKRVWGNPTPFWNLFQADFFIVPHGAWMDRRAQGLQHILPREHTVGRV